MLGPLTRRLRGARLVSQAAELIVGGLDVSRGQGGGDNSGADTVHPHTVGPKLQRDGLSELDHGRFGGREHQLHGLFGRLRGGRGQRGRA